MHIRSCLPSLEPPSPTRHGLISSGLPDLPGRRSRTKTAVLFRTNLGRLASRSFPIAGGKGGTASLYREQIIETYRISDAHNVTGRVVVEPQGDVEIQLLIWTEAIQSAGIQELG